MNQVLVLGMQDTQEMNEKGFPHPKFNLVQEIYHEYGEWIEIKWGELLQKYIL